MLEVYFARVLFSSLSSLAHYSWAFCQPSIRKNLSHALRLIRDAAPKLVLEHRIVGIRYDRLEDYILFAFKV